MKKTKGLGRGLDALWGEDIAISPAQADGEAVVSLSLTEIDPNRGQPRRRFDENALKELADSIRAVGVLQPILVARSGARYTIIAGERRWRAAKLAGLAQIPAIMRDYAADRQLEAALIENLQRDDLNPVDEAMGVKSLMERCGYTQEMAAERLGKSRPAIANLLRLLTLENSVLKMLEDGQLSAGHGRALVTIPADQQVKLAQIAVQQGWSVRQLERACTQITEGDSEKEEKPAAPRNPEIARLERMAREAFGTKAEISGDEARGRLTLHYYTPEDLQRIWDVLEGMKG